jgi:uncharacterized protein YegP (UPF0339 family)
MSTRTPRFELVSRDTGHFARYIAANGKEVWRTSETYKRLKGAERAVELIAGHPIKEFQGAHEIAAPYTLAPETGLREVRYVEERTPKP